LSAGKSVKIFMADGTPGGLLTAEIMNWTGHVVAAPGSDLAALLKRPEVSRTGTYILLGTHGARAAQPWQCTGAGANRHTKKSEKWNANRQGRKR
jgi:hypothetical protein